DGAIVTPCAWGGRGEGAMIHWLPNRIIQGAALVCAGASLALFWLVLSQPWLGVTLAVNPVDAQVDLVAVDAQGPAAQVPVPSRLVAMEPAGDPARRIDLNAIDLLEEPDVLDTYERARQFMRRQSDLAGLLRQDRITLQ